MKTRERKKRSEQVVGFGKEHWFLSEPHSTKWLPLPHVGMKTRFIEKLTGSRDMAYNDLTLGSPPAKYSRF